MESAFGVAAVEAAFSSMPPDVANGLCASSPHFGALPATWYDARIYRHLFDSLIRDENVDLLARDAARAVLEQTLRGIYARLFGLMATPPLYARYAQKMWDTHYDTGIVTVQQVSPTVAVHTVKGWAGHHPFVCAVNRQSGTILYSMMELRNVKIEKQRCLSPICEAEYSWDP
jgi:hypothetical protein